MTIFRGFVRLQDVEDRLLQRRATNDRVVDADEAVLLIHHTVGDIVNMRDELLAGRLLRDKGAELDVLVRDFFTLGQLSRIRRSRSASSRVPCLIGLKNCVFDLFSSMQTDRLEHPVIGDLSGIRHEAEDAIGEVIINRADHLLQ